MKFNILRSSLILLIALNLFSTGCAKLANPYDEEFNCKANPKGGKCVSTPTAYKDAKNSTSSTEDNPSNCIDGNCGGLENNQSIDGDGTRSNLSRSIAQDKRYKTISALLEEPKTPILIPPTVLRVLFMPYKGENGALFMKRYVYVEVSPSDWSLTDINE